MEPLSASGAYAGSGRGSAESSCPSPEYLPASATAWPEKVVSSPASRCGPTYKPLELLKLTTQPFLTSRKKKTLAVFYNVWRRPPSLSGSSRSSLRDKYFSSDRKLFCSTAPSVLDSRGNRGTQVVSRPCNGKDQRFADGSIQHNTKSKQSLNAGILLRRVCSDSFKTSARRTRGTHDCS